ncbi:MAG: addiction module protein [Leptolyngbya sp. Prado105]|nr:addiction module protein [Leptolyngbya sp. Prado105]
MKSLDAQDQAIIDAAWAEVAEQRVQEIQQGKAIAIPASQVLQELRNRVSSNGL